MLKKLEILLLLIVFSASSAASLIAEDFSGGKNGWSYIQTDGGKSSIGFLTTHPETIVTNGGPSGSGDSYLQYEDVDGNYMHAVFGSGWSGDLSRFNNGIFSFDYVQTFPTISGANTLEDFGYFRIFGGGKTAAFDAVSINPSRRWTTQSFIFNADTFNVTESDWNSIISDVTAIWLNVESDDFIREKVGIDNVSLRTTSVSEPSLVSAFGLIFLSMMCIRRRR